MMSATLDSDSYFVISSPSNSSDNIIVILRLDDESRVHIMIFLVG